MISNKLRAKYEKMGRDGFCRSMADRSEGAKSTSDELNRVYTKKFKGNSRKIKRLAIRKF